MPSDCEKFQEAITANTLHFCRPEWLALASFDPDLRRVVAAWADLPGALRKAMLALIAPFQISPVI